MGGEGAGQPSKGPECWVRRRETRGVGVNQPRGSRRRGGPQSGLPLLGEEGGDAPPPSQPRRWTRNH